jgi:hypothetical protein
MIERQSLTGNLPIKLLALALAVALWLMASEAKQGEMDLSIPVAIRNMPAGLTVQNRIPPEIRVTVVGPRFSLQRVHPEQTPLPLDMTGVGEGTVTFSAMDKRLRLPQGISVLRVYPSDIELKLVRASRTGVH